MLEKVLRDCVMEGNVITLDLTEEDTLLLDCKQCVEIQLRIGCGRQRLASNIIRENVGRILKEGCL